MAEDASASTSSLPADAWAGCEQGKSLKLSACFDPRSTFSHRLLDARLNPRALEQLCARTLDYVCVRFYDATDHEDKVSERGQVSLRLFSDARIAEDEIVVHPWISAHFSIGSGDQVSVSRLTVREDERKHSATVLSTIGQRVVTNSESHEPMLVVLPSSKKINMTVAGLGGIKPGGLLEKMFKRKLDGLVAPCGSVCSVAVHILQSIVVVTICEGSQQKGLQREREDPLGYRVSRATNMRLCIRGGDGIQWRRAEANESPKIPYYDANLKAILDAISPFKFKMDLNWNSVEEKSCASREFISGGWVWLTGTSGIGKSRLLKTVWNAYGGVFVDLAALSTNFEEHNSVRDLTSRFEEVVKMLISNNSTPNMIFLDHFEVCLYANPISNEPDGLVSTIVHPLEVLQRYRNQLPIVVVCSSLQLSYAQVFEASLATSTSQFKLSWREIEMQFPGYELRIRILREVLLATDIATSKVCSRRGSTSENKDIEERENRESVLAVIQEVARATAGFTPRDILRLCRDSESLYQALMIVQRKSSSAETFCSYPSQVMCLRRSLESYRLLLPSRLGQAVKAGIVPSVRGSGFDGIGGHVSAKKTLQMMLQRWQDPRLGAKLGMNAPKGVLIVGGVGVGKTALARAMSTQAHVPLLEIGSADLFSKYFGESSKAVRRVFEQAKVQAPSMLLLDGLDAIGSRRSHLSSDSASDAVQGRVLSALLNELDGIEERSNVFVIGVTSRVEALDDALTRPGRFDTIVRLSAAADVGEIEDILRVLTQKVRVEEGLDLQNLAKALYRERSQSNPWTGADLKGLIAGAGIASARRGGPDVTCITRADFEIALRQLMFMVEDPEERRDEEEQDNEKENDRREDGAMIDIDEKTLRTSYLKMIAERKNGTLITKENKRGSWKGRKDGSYIYVECPRCRGLIEIKRNQLACRVLRHAEVSPHAPEAVTMGWVTRNQNKGCGAPLLIRTNEKGEYEAVLHPNGYKS